MVVYPKTVSEHPSIISATYPSQHDRETLEQGKTDSPPHQVQDNTVAFEQIYNSWGLDPYLDCSGTRDSILYSADQTGLTKDREYAVLQGSAEYS